MTLWLPFCNLQTLFNTSIYFMPHPNPTIPLDGRLLSAMLDPQYTVSEVFQYWQEIAGAFPFLGNLNIKKEDAAWDQQYLMAVARAPVTATIPPPGKSGDADILHAHFGIPVYRPGTADTHEWIVSFMTPERHPVFPFRLVLTRNVVYEHPYFILGIETDPGTWGARHLQFKAIETVFKALEGVEDPGLPDGTAREKMEPHWLETWEQQAAAAIAARLATWENDEVDFHRIKQELWACANQLVQRFSKGKPPILHKTASNGSPYDLSVSHPGEPFNAIPEYALSAFEQFVWMEQLQWWENSAGRRRTIAYWKARKTTPEWDAFFNGCMGGVKGTWPSLVEVLQQPPVSAADMERLISFLADINWPGAFEAYDFLKHQGAETMKYLDEAMEDAAVQNDSAWLEMIQYTREMLTDENDQA